MQQTERPTRPKQIRWRRPRVDHRRLKKPGQLTPEEAACVEVALAFMVARVGNAQLLSFKMGLDRTAVRRALKKRPAPGIAMALEIARVAGVTVDDVLAGRFPEPGSCPTCGQVDTVGATLGDAK